MAYRAKSIVGAQIPVFRFALLLIVFHIHVHVSASSSGPVPVMAVHVAFHPAFSATSLYKKQDTRYNQCNRPDDGL